MNRLSGTVQTSGKPLWKGRKSNGTSRPKSRVDLLVDSLTSLPESAAALNQIDRRHTRGIVRDHIKTARVGAATARDAIEKALQTDLPAAPSR